MFQCDKCGMCCRNLDKNELYKELDRGDGVCRHLTGNLCNIYEQRPLLCRVDESYKKLFRGRMSLEEYYELNYSACRVLKKQI